jgi:hypothetical protein
MNARTWSWRLVWVVGAVFGLGLGGLSWAGDNNNGGKGKDGKVIIIQIDASKLPPDMLRRLLEISRSTGKEDDRRPAKKEDDRKPKPKKEAGKKPNIVQVDLNKLSPDLARRLTAELAKLKAKKADDDDDDDDRRGSKSKGKVKKDDDDDDDDDRKASKRKGKAKKDDDDDGDDDTQVALQTLLVLTSSTQAGEEKVPLDKVPKVVMAAFKARFKDAKPTEATKETVDGKLHYEITFKEKGLNVDVTLSAEGVLLMIEKEITAKDLPRAAAKALRDKYPKATYKIVEEIIKVEKKAEKLLHYEVLLVTAQNETVEVQVTAEGKIINEEKQKPEKKGDVK